MDRSLGGDYRQGLTGGFAAFVLGLSLFAPQAFMATGFALLAAGLAFFSWMSCHRRARAIADTPTSRIESAAQGHVELSGTLHPLPGHELRAPLSGEPCLWYRFREERYNGSDWDREREGESDASFLLDDGSGACLLRPRGAEMTGLQAQTWYNDARGDAGWRRLSKDDRRRTEWLLREGEAAHVVGDFRTLRDASSGAETHVIERPAGGRPFLLRRGTDGESAGSTAYRRWAIFHVVVFLAALGSLPHALGKPWGL
jgi:hypothetical protein